MPQNRSMKNIYNISRWLQNTHLTRPGFWLSEVAMIHAPRETFPKTWTPGGSGAWFYQDYFVGEISMISINSSNLEKVTPKLAKKWLHQNTFERQRNMRPHHRDTLAKEIQSGRFIQGT
jgi:hypothetical protein